MKKLLLILLAVMVTACAAPATPVPAPTAPPPAPIVVTVVVEPTQAPQQQQVAPQQPVVITVVVPATAEPAQPAVVPPTEAPVVANTPDPNAPAVPIAIDDILGKGVFKNITLSGNEFTLRCLPRELTITATASLVDITDAQLFYRVRDYPKALYDSQWRSAGKMTKLGNGVFTMTLTGETVHPDARLDPGWFDFQIVGLNKGGGRIDQTQKIEKMIIYRVNCP